MALLTASMMHQDAVITADSSGNDIAPIAAAMSVSQEQQLFDKLAMAQDVSRPERSTSNFKMQRNARPGSIQITPEFVDQCLDVAEEVNPEWAASIRNVCESSPDEFERFLRQSGRRLIMGVGEDVSYLTDTHYLTFADLNDDWQAFKDDQSEGGM